MTFLLVLFGAWVLGELLLAHIRVRRLMARQEFPTTETCDPPAGSPYREAGCESPPTVQQKLLPLFPSMPGPAPREPLTVFVGPGADAADPPEAQGERLLMLILTYAGKYNQSVGVTTPEYLLLCASPTFRALSEPLRDRRGFQVGGATILIVDDEWRS